MKKIIQYFLVFLLLTISFACKNNLYQVYRLDQQSEFLNKEGMFYFLPRTVVNIEVTVEKTDQVKGPYSSFSSKYLGISNVISENNTTYNIVDIKAKTLNEPDPDKIFFIVFPKSSKRKNQLMIALKENGIIESINYTTDSLSAQSGSLRTSGLYDDFDHDSQPFKMFINYNIMEKVDTIIEYVHLDTMTIEKQVFKKSLIEKDLEQRAKDASEYIIKLNEHKINLLSGYQEIEYSENTLSFMVSSIEQMVDEYMSLFVGKTVTQTMTFNFTYTPEASTKNRSFFLFSIDKSKGISDVESSDPSKNIYIELMPSLTTSKIAPIVSSQKDNLKNRKGFYYNIPEKTKLILSRGRTDLIFENNIMINQFGVIHFLPAKNYKVLYFDNSASIRRIQ
jgi:hypothetical protein